MAALYDATLLVYILKTFVLCTTHKNSEPNVGGCSQQGKRLLTFAMAYNLRIWSDTRASGEILQIFKADVAKSFCVIMLQLAKQNDWCTIALNMHTRTQF